MRGIAWSAIRAVLRRARGLPRRVSHRLRRRPQRPRAPEPPDYPDLARHLSELARRYRDAADGDERP